MLRQDYGLEAKNKRAVETNYFAESLGDEDSPYIFPQPVDTNILPAERKI